MPWFKVDDAFHGHPKVMELSPAAVGVWTLAGSWCANYLTDGEIKASIVRRFGADDAMVQELVEAGLWIDVGGAYQFKDWDEYQPLKEEVMAERNAARDRMKAVRAKKKGVERSPEQLPNVQPNDTGTFEGTSEEVRVTPSLSLPVPVPVPIPLFPELPAAPSSVEEAKPRSNRKTSCPKEFPVTDSMASWAKENEINADLNYHTAKFLDHHASKGSKFVDWTRAWQNWMRNSKEWAKPQADPNAIVPAGYAWANR